MSVTLQTENTKEVKSAQSVSLFSFNNSTIANDCIGEIATEVNISDKAFAIKLEDTSFEPIAPVGSIIVLDPKIDNNRKLSLVEINGSLRICNIKKEDRKVYIIDIVNLETDKVEFPGNHKVYGSIVHIKREKSH